MVVCSLQRGAGDKTTFSLGHEGATLLLDVENLSKELHLKPGSLYMVIGEISDQLSGPCLQARVARNVDGMDLHLFEEALKLHRQFLRQQQELHMPIDSSSEQRA